MALVYGPGGSQLSNDPQYATKTRMARADKRERKGVTCSPQTRYMGVISP